jgi:hypothetical protein
VTPVYNFEVEGDHSYFVGLLGQGICVHNNCQIEGIFKNPAQLAGKTLEEVQALVGDVAPPWIVDRMRKSDTPGWVLREILGNGRPSDRYLQYHPGGGHHGADPYWKLSSGATGTCRFPAGR